MKKLIATVVAAAFAFGAASTFAGPAVKTEPVKAQHQVRHATHDAKHAKVHKVKHAKMHKAKHGKKKAHRHARHVQR